MNSALTEYMGLLKVVVISGIHSYYKQKLLPFRILALYSNCFPTNSTRCYLYLNVM